MCLLPHCKIRATEHFQGGYVSLLILSKDLDAVVQCGCGHEEKTNSALTTGAGQYAMRKANSLMLSFDKKETTY